MVVDNSLFAKFFPRIFFANCHSRQLFWKLSFLIFFFANCHCGLFFAKKIRILLQMCFSTSKENCRSGQLFATCRSGSSLSNPKIIDKSWDVKSAIQKQTKIQKVEKYSALAEFAKSEMYLYRRCSPHLRSLLSTIPASVECFQCFQDCCCFVQFEDLSVRYGMAPGTYLLVKWNDYPPFQQPTNM